MKRRNVLLGLGASAAGSGIVFGTGAFTQIEAERSLTIGVNEDDSALLALDAGDNVASVYNSDNQGQNTDNAGTGELVIDTEELSGGNEGFNVGARAQIGETESDLPDPENDSPTVPGDSSGTNADDVAFVVTNNFGTVEGGTDSSNEIDVKLNLSTVNPGDGTLYFIGTQYDGNGEVTTNVADTDGSNSDTVVTFTLAPDDKIYFVIQIQTGNTTNPGDFGGTVTFSVVPTGS
jgi:hypothetical protein